MTATVFLAGAVLCMLFYLLVLRDDIIDLQDIVDLQKSKEDLRKCIERLKREKREQRKKLTAEIHALRTQLHQLRKEHNTQSNG